MFVGVGDCCELLLDDFLGGALAPGEDVEADHHPALIADGGAQLGQQPFQFPG